MPIRLLTLAEVVEIHADQISRYGGAAGMRDLNGLEAALGMPGAGVGEEYFHAFPFGMAAAYAYHLCQNHSFTDGNKRVALAAALVFLKLNGVEINDPEGSLFGLMIEVAVGRASKVQVAEALERLAGLSGATQCR